MNDHLDLFSGIGGFALAARWAGIKTIRFVEIDPFCQKVLRKNFPGVPIHDDIKTFTVDTYVSLCYNQLSQENQEVIDMGTKKKDYDVAVNLYDSGLSIQDVADFYGVSRQSMWMVLKRRGCEFRSNLKYGKDNHFFRNGCTAPDRIHNIVELAVEKGLLTRKTHCEKCNATGVKINAHHKDYNKPLEVDWLCSDCHYAWHKDNKAVELNIDFPTMSRTEICRRGGARKEVTTDELQQRIENATKTTILTAGVP